MAAALASLQGNGLTDYEQLKQKAKTAAERFYKLPNQIKSTEAPLHTNMELKAATVQYAKTRPVFEKYKASKYSKKILAEHEADIELYRAACANFKRILDSGNPENGGRLSAFRREPATSLFYPVDNGVPQKAGTARHLFVVVGGEPFIHHIEFLALLALRGQPDPDGGL